MGFKFVTFALFSSLGFLPATAEENKRYTQGFTVLSQAQQPTPHPKVQTDSIDELIQEQAKAKQEYQKLNQLNPMSEDFNFNKRPDPKTFPTAAPIQIITEPPPEANPGSTKLQALLSNPFVKFFMALTSDSQFQQGSKEVLSHPNKMYVVYLNAFVFIFIILLRTWKSAQTFGIVRKLWLNIWTLGLFWVLCVFVVPTAVLGSSFTKTLEAIYQVGIKHFFHQQNQEREIANVPYLQETSNSQK